MILHDIDMARENIKGDSATSEEGKKPNYFIAIRVSDRGIRDKVETVQNKVVSRCDSLKPFLTPVETLHLSLFVMHLEGKEQIDKAKEILQQCSNGPFKIKFKGLGCFSYPKKSDPTIELRKVLYVKPEEKGNERLYAVQAVVEDTFTEEDIPSADPREWTPHIAVIKLRGNNPEVEEIPEKSFETCIDWDFGEEQVSSLYLCPIGKEAQGGFYKGVAEIDLCDR